MNRALSSIAAVTLLLTHCLGADGGNKAVAEALGNAMAASDLVAIRAAVAEARSSLGKKAGIPEIPDEFRIPNAGVKMLTREEARQGFAAHFGQLEKMRWWNIGVDPTKLAAPLRGVGSVITGNVSAMRAKLEGAERGLVMAKEAADFLIWAQEQGGAGCYPFPAARGTSGARAMEVATRFLKNAEKTGKLENVVHNGWAVDDLGDGGLQFDNGECGVAMFELYELTKDARYFDSACKAADWAATRPLCVNWNYNSFSVRLLAKAFMVSGEARYLEAAVTKARLGVIPGQLVDGPHAGRWMDPHNARPAYHYVMMCALAQLAAVLPPSHEHHAEIVRSLTLGLTARNIEMTQRGVMNKDHAMEALLLVRASFASDPTFLEVTKTPQALHALALLVSAETRGTRLPLSPGAWGKFLEYVNSSSN